MRTENVERREAQRPAGRPRKPADSRPEVGLANLPLKSARGRPDRKGPAHEGPRKPLAPPGAPFPFGKGKRETGFPGAAQTTRAIMRVLTSMWVTERNETGELYLVKFASHTL